jgi:hypothetical protein
MRIEKYYIENSNLQPVKENDVKGFIDVIFSFDRVEPIHRKKWCSHLFPEAGPCQFAATTH